MSTSIHQLISTSIPCDSLTPAVLADVMARACVHNARCDVTGILLYTEEQFMQVFEGPPDEVEKLMERIPMDPRHEDVRIILSHNVAQRDFGEWDMALREGHLEALGPRSALSDFYQPDFDIRSLHYGSPASFPLQAFRELHAETGRRAAQI